MSDRVQIGALQVADELHAFVRDEALGGSGIDEAAFWVPGQQSCRSGR
jgi:malate synthase